MKTAAPIAEEVSGEAGLPSDRAPFVSGAFIENRGQWSGPAAFAFRGGGAVAHLLPDGVQVALEADDGDLAIAQLRFVGARRHVSVDGLDPLPGVLHYLVGERDRWRRDVQRFSRVMLHGLYESVDLQWRSVSGHLEYDLFVDDPARLDAIVVACEGAEGLERLPSGDLLIRLPGGATLLQPRPTSWQELPDGERRPVACEFRLLGGGHYGFEVPPELGAEPLVIDPGLIWSTYLGGEFTDHIADVTVGPTGDVLVTGHTTSEDFPSTPGVFQPAHAGTSGIFGNDAYVACFDDDVSELRFATFIGGTKNDFPVGLAIDGDGLITVAGRSASGEFPTTAGALQAPCETAAFALKLLPDGSDLVWSARIGGCEGTTWVNDFALHETGEVTVVGATTAEDYPTTPGSLQPEPAAPGPFFRDGLVSRLSADGSALVYSTFLGGSDSDEVATVTANAAGCLWVAGPTDSEDLPVSEGAWSNEPMDGFVACLAADASALQAMTYFGGVDLAIRDIVVGPDGSITLAGRSGDPGFPTTPGAFDPTSDTQDAFVSRFEPDLATLIFSTVVGGGLSDYGRRIAVDGSGRTTLVGSTNSSTFPTTPGAYQPEVAAPLGDEDLFIARFSPDGSQLEYSSFLGGVGDETTTATPGMALWLAPDGGDVIVGGRSQADDYPTTPGAFDTTQNGFGDAVITRLDMLPTGAARYGSSTPGCDGPLGIGVTAMPQVGAAFAVTGTNAPPGADGFLAVSPVALTEPLVVGGAEIWVDPARVALLPVDSSGLGAVEVPFALPDDPRLVGVEAALQFLWPDDCAPTWLSASRGLRITVQPGG